MDDKSPKLLFDAVITERIFKMLRERGVNGSCPECGTQRQLHPGFVHHALQSQTPVPDTVFSESFISTLPTIQVICPQCGHVSWFAYKILCRQEPVVPEKPIVEERRLTIVKDCPECGEMMSPFSAVCTNCGFDPTS